MMPSWQTATCFHTFENVSSINRHIKVIQLTHASTLAAGKRVEASSELNQWESVTCVCGVTVCGRDEEEVTRTRRCWRTRGPAEELSRFWMSWFDG